MDLEDHFYRLRDQHLHVKKEAQEAKNQVKVLTTRVARLLSDKKARLKGQRTAREVELEELIFDMNSRVFELERENFRLKEKSLLLRSQLESSHPRQRDVSSAYSHVQARVDSGLRRKPLSANAGLSRHKSFSTTSLNKGGDVNHNWSTRPIAARGVQVRLAPKGDHNHKLQDPVHLHLLFEARDEIKDLEHMISVQERQLCQMLQSKDMGMSESLNQGKISQNKQDMNHNDQENVSSPSNVDRQAIVINGSPGLRSQVAAVASSALALKDRARGSSRAANLPLKANLKLYRAFDSNHEATNEKVMAIVESLKAELRHEKEKNSHLEKEILSSKMSARTQDQLKHRVNELEEENQILQDSLRKCVGSCFSEIKGSGNRSKDVSLEAKRLEIVETLQKQNHRLQEKLKHAESENASLQKQLLYEQENIFRLDEENAKLSTRLEELVNSYGDLTQQPTTHCQRSDHTSMESQLTQMQKERTEVLREFSEMRQMLETIQSNIHKEDEQEVYEDDFEETTTASDRVPD